MVFLSVVVIPVLLFLTAGMLRAPASTFKFVGMFLLVCVTILVALWCLGWALFAVLGALY